MKRKSQSVAPTVVVSLAATIVNAGCRNPTYTRYCVDDMGRRVNDIDCINYVATRYYSVRRTGYRTDCVDEKNQVVPNTNCQGPMQNGRFIRSSALRAWAYSLSGQTRMGQIVPNRVASAPNSADVKASNGMIIRRGFRSGGSGFSSS